MSIECGICERDLRGPHDKDCPHHPEYPYGYLFVEMKNQIAEKDQKIIELTEELQLCIEIKRSLDVECERLEQAELLREWRRL